MIIPVQQCRSLDGWVPVEVPSRSEPDVRHVVLVNPWGDESESICQCKGYNYRGKCAHQQKAFDSICGWHQLEGPEKQRSWEEEEMICARCGGATMWTMEWVDPNE